jgi:hypothetical protein
MAQELQQQNHLMVVIRGTTPGVARPAYLIARNPLRPLVPAGARLAGGIQNVGAQKSRDELQLVGRKASHEAAGLGLTRTIGTRNQSGNQSASHVRSPVCEKSYFWPYYHENKVAAQGLGTLVLVVTGSREYAV